MIISKTKFLKRFSAEEIATILVARNSPPALNAYLYKLEQAIDIDTEDDDMVNGVYLLEAAGLLADGHAAKILHLGYAVVKPPFGDNVTEYEIIENLSNQTVVLLINNEQVAFAAGNYEVKNGN